MTSILFWTEAIYCHISDGIISETRDIFSIFDSFLDFPNLDSILNIFKKKMTLIGDVFLKLRTPKNVVR